MEESKLMQFEDGLGRMVQERLSRAEVEQIVARIRERIQTIPGAAFAYVHGSFTGEGPSRDIDIAVTSQKRPGNSPPTGVWKHRPFCPTSWVCPWMFTRWTPSRSHSLTASHRAGCSSPTTLISATNSKSARSCDI